MKPGYTTDAAVPYIDTPKRYYEGYQGVHHESKNPDDLFGPMPIDAATRGARADTEDDNTPKGPSTRTHD